MHTYVCALGVLRGMCAYLCVCAGGGEGDVYMVLRGMCEYLQVCAGGVEGMCEYLLVCAGGVEGDVCIPMCVRWGDVCIPMCVRWGC